MLNNIKSSQFIYLHYKSKKKNFCKSKKKCRKISKRCLLNKISLSRDLIGYGFFLSRMPNLPKRQKKRVNLWGQLAFLWPGQLTVC